MRAWTTLIFLSSTLPCGGSQLQVASAQPFYLPCLSSLPSIASELRRLSSLLINLSSSCVQVVRDGPLYNTTNLAVPKADPLQTALTSGDLLKCPSWRRSPNDTHPPLPFSVPSSASWESVEFNLPIDAEVLFVAAKGSLSSGIVRVHQSPEVKDLKVSVAAHYHKKEVLSSARVCLVERGLGNGVKGIEILVRPYP